MRVIYFGIFNPEFSRNKVFRDALLAQGDDVEVMSERGKGIGKYIRLAKRLRSERIYDAVIVGYPGYTCTPLTKLFSRKPVIFDALCTYWEGQVLSRDAYRGNPFGLAWCRFIDWLSVKSADAVLVETKAQKDFFIERFGASEAKVQVVYTGVDEASFGVSATPDPKRFIVLFRGRITEEAGVEVVIKAAKLLEGSGVEVRIIGFGWGPPLEHAKRVLAELKPTNLEWIDRQLPIGELVEAMCGCSVSLGQFGDNDRLNRTIPHKAFEAMLMGLPYITADAAGIREAFEDDKSALFVPAGDPEALRDAIVELYDQSAKRISLAVNAKQVYDKLFSKAVVGARLVNILRHVSDTQNHKK